MNKKEILHQAIEHFKLETNLQADYDLKNENAMVTFKINKQKTTFKADIKIELKAYQVEVLKNRIRIDPNYIVIAEHIYPAVKNKLRELGIAYMDTAGNTFVQHEQLFLFVNGNKKKEKEKKHLTTNRAFTKTGLRTVFYLLLHPEAITYTYRELAKKTKVALGNVKNIIDGLKDAGYILKKDEKTLILINKKDLLERWIDGYKETLKPCLEIGRYKYNDQIEKDIANKFKNEFVIGGEYAAEKITEYLKAVQYSFYTVMPKLDAMRALKLVPDNNGNLILYNKFWENEILYNNNRHLTLTPLILIYADLMITNDPRCKETAIKIYDKYLKNEFE